MEKVLAMPKNKGKVYVPANEYSAGNSVTKRRVLPMQDAGEDQILSTGRRLPLGAGVYNGTDLADMEYGG